MPRSSDTAVRLPPDIALHARPAADLVRAAIGFSSEISITANGREANAKSLLAVLGLGATGGTELVLRANGNDAVAAVEELQNRILSLVE